MSGIRFLTQAKNFVKRLPLIYRLNAVVKAKLTRWRTRRLNEFYTWQASKLEMEYRAEAIPSAVQQRIRKHVRQPVTKHHKGDLRILWVGANREQDYSGFIQGLRRYGTVTEFTRPDGRYGQEFPDPGIEYDEGVIVRNSVRLLELAEVVKQRDGGLDLVLGQMWANFISVEALMAVQKGGVVTANVAMDDRLPDLWRQHRGMYLGSVGLVEGLDLVLTSAPECLIRYHVHGCPAIFWPMASDPDLFKPAANKDIDVSFVGNKYGIRGEIVGRLQSRGIHVDAYGAGWPNGPIGPEKASEVFGRSKIILGIGTIGYNNDIFTLKLRDFDATMAGALYVTHRNPDLLQMFTESQDIECYQSVDEAVDKIEYYLSHSELITRIGLSAAVKARAHHTWDCRLGEAMHTLGLIKD